MLTGNSISAWFAIDEKKEFTRMMVSKVLRTLEEKKIITRQEHEKDTRAKTIQLTKTGIETLQKAIKSKKCR